MKKKGVIISILVPKQLHKEFKKFAVEESKSMQRILVDAIESLIKGAQKSTECNEDK